MLRISKFRPIVYIWIILQLIPLINQFGSSSCVNLKDRDLLQEINSKSSHKYVAYRFKIVAAANSKNKTLPPRIVFCHDRSLLIKKTSIIAKVRQTTQISRGTVRIDEIPSDGGEKFCMGIIENWIVIVVAEDEEKAEDKNKYNGFVTVDAVAAQIQSGRSTAKESGALLRNSRSHRATELLSTRHSNSVDSSTSYRKKRRNGRFSSDFYSTTRNRSVDNVGQKVATMRCLEDSKNVNCRRVKQPTIVENFRGARPRNSNEINSSKPSKKSTHITRSRMGTRKLLSVDSDQETMVENDESATDQFNSKSSQRLNYVPQKTRPELLLTGDLEASLNDDSTEESGEDSGINHIGKRSEKPDDYWKDIDIKFHARVHFITNPRKKGTGKHNSKSKRYDVTNGVSNCTDSSCSTSKGAVQLISDFFKKTISRITNKEDKEVHTTTTTTQTQLITQLDDFSVTEAPAAKNVKYIDDLEDFNYTSLADESVSTTPDQYCSCDDPTETGTPEKVTQASPTMSPEKESKMEKMLEIVDTVKKLENLIKESQEGPQEAKSSDIVMKLQKFSGSPKILSNANTRDLDALRDRIVRTLARSKSKRNANKKNNDNRARRKKIRGKKRRKKNPNQNGG